MHREEDFRSPPKDLDEKLVIDKVEKTDQSTTKDVKNMVEDSMMTDDKGDDMKDTDFHDFANEDTLDGL